MWCDSGLVRRAALSATVVLMIASSGCILSSDDEKKKSNDGGFRYLPRTSPENVLDNLASAYRNRDVDAYVDQLDPDFLFEASAADHEIDFDYLSYDQDVTATANMFENVDAIHITLDHDGAVPSDRATYPPEEGYMKILVPAVRIDVLSRIRDEASGELITFRISGDPAVFIFGPDPSKAPVEYRLVYQQDLFTGRLAGHGAGDLAASASVAGGLR